MYATRYNRALSDPRLREYIERGRVSIITHSPLVILPRFNQCLPTLRCVGPSLEKHARPRVVGGDEWLSATSRNAAPRIDFSPGQRLISPIPFEDLSSSDIIIPRIKGSVLVVIRNW